MTDPSKFEELIEKKAPEWARMAYEPRRDVFEIIEKETGEVRGLISMTMLGAAIHPDRIIEGEFAMARRRNHD